MSIKNTKGNATSIYYIKHVTCAKVLQDLNYGVELYFPLSTHQKTAIY